MGSSPSPPTPPNPSATAQAQTGMNVTSAEATDLMNMVNQITPYGSLNYNQTGQQTVSVPTYDSNGNPTGQSVSYNIPTYTATQSYSPTGQKLLQYQEAAQLNAGQAGQSLSGQIANEFAQPIQLPGVPNPVNVPTGQNWTNLPNVPNPLDLPGAPTALQTPTLDMSNQAIQNQLYSEYSPRVQMQQGIQSQATAAQLAAQGLTPGSAAYNNAMQLQNQSFNDQWNQMYLSGQSEAANEILSQYNAALQGQAQTFGQQQQTYSDLFQNVVQGTQEQQNYFANQYQNALNAETQQQQNYQNAMSTANMTEAELQQYYQNQMTNTMQQYNFPLQALSALMGTGAPGQPTFGQTPTTSIAPANYEGDVQNAYADQMSAYNAQMQQQNAMMGGIFSLFGSLGSGLMASDERLKTGVNDNEPEKVGELENELPVYLYRYKAGGPPQIGVMAQDVEKVNPDAVRTIGGMRFVDYRKAVS